MSFFDQKMCAWGGPFSAVFLGTGLLMAGFVPPPSPALTANQIAAIYQANSGMIRAGMVLGLAGIAGYIALVGAISAQMRRMQGVSRLPPYLQLGAGSMGVLTVMFPIMIFACAAFRPERDSQLTQMLNDVGWLLIIPAFPTFLAQFLAIAFGTLQDKSPDTGIPTLGRLLQYLGRHPICARWLRIFLSKRAVRMGRITCILGCSRRIFCLDFGHDVADAECDRQ